MASGIAHSTFVCPACAGSTCAPVMCPECTEAFALARRAHPATLGTRIDASRAASHALSVVDDVDLWDEWALLGDVGGRVAQGVTE